MAIFHIGRYVKPSHQLSQLYSSAVALCALLGCGVGEIRVSDYLTTCNAHEDCVVVREGECGDCGHPRSPAAINVRDLERYEFDYDRLDCKGGDDLVCDLDAAVYQAVCTAGVCAADRVDG